MERYENAVWQNGTVITAASLNRIEENLRDVIGCVIDMGSNLTTTNKIKAGKLQVGVPETETEIGNGDALITGNVIINGTPGNNNHAVTKGYVDGKEINALEGITATGTLGGNGGITIGLSAATTNTLGGIKVGSNLSYNDSILDLPAASTSAIGGIKVGSNLSYNNNVLDLPIASASAIGGIKVGSNLTINGEGVLSATDTTYALANGTTPGLMSAANYTKLDRIPADATNNTGTVTGISINGGATQSPTNGVVNISVITSHQDITGKADTDDSSFTGIASFGNNIRINCENNTIAIGSAVLSEPQLNILYSILPQDDIPDGYYTLKLSKSTVNNEPVFAYTWESVNNAGGGE